jgi:enoyl-CoA hydratase
MPLIEYERSDAIAVIRLNRTEKLNALSREMIVVLSDLFTNQPSQSDLRAIILTGTGDRAFCVGSDITELASLDNDQALEVSQRAQSLCSQIETSGVPVIAAINGSASGAGCELALACHIRIASVNAQFIFCETKLGTSPGYERAQRLAREIGEGHAAELLLPGRTVSAEEALRFGLVNHVVPAAELLAQAEGLANEIAQLAPLAIRACLKAVTEGTQLPLAEGLALESKLFASLFATEDVREGTSAFLEKRAPVFKGK